MGMYDWLGTLKEGDSVFVKSVYGNRYNPAKVAKITGTQIVILHSETSRPRRFRRKDGYEVGSSGFERCSLVRGDSAKAIETSKRDAMESTLHNLRQRVHTMNVETLDALTAALKPFTKGPATP